MCKWNSEYEGGFTKPYWLDTLPLLNKHTRISKSMHWIQVLQHICGSVRVLLAIFSFTS